MRATGTLHQRMGFFLIFLLFYWVSEFVVGVFSDFVEFMYGFCPHDIQIQVSNFKDIHMYLFLYHAVTLFITEKIKSSFVGFLSN